MSLAVPPYPPTRYMHGEPQVSATLRRADEPPDFEAFGVSYHDLANQQKTDVLRSVRHAEALRRS